MKVIGITGGIGSGKTTVANLIRKHGYTVFDTDIEARIISTTDINVINDIKKEFGSDLYNDGKLDRKKLADIVFNDKPSLEKLNSIFNGKLREKILSEIESSEEDLYFIECAILFESGLDELVDSVLSITAPEYIRIDRVMKRDNVTKKEVLSRMNNQMKESDKLSKSDYIITSNQKLDVIERVLLNLIKDMKK